MNEKILKSLREKYYVGARVKLINMEDKYAPKAGTLGTVIGVDDIGSILVSWDDGISLNVVYGVDHCSLIDEKKE